MLPIYQTNYVEPTNTKDLRYMVRANGNAGFLFINNYQDRLTLPDRTNVQICLNTENGDVVIPQNREMEIKSDEMLILPFGMEMGEICLKYATVQPLFYMDDQTYIFFAHEGTQAEYAFLGQWFITSDKVRTEYNEGITYVYPSALGLDCSFQIGNVNISKYFRKLNVSQMIN